eukprot:CAMPEP_0174375358 /NCGR_PEP_ID=MMETSP0811_2-20130205/114293_1 /TAXON_ID=73025 ORGANISM="Eutreptiella gymnastica-like, Strain CCMP1594" /NCGR_SAMPLE_ID=MMETSP0811_2 /ASSEMBLY_ACC=CAM_ASM_000667 /LENGTH=75 /DNA_ID=CAMNT_0015525495 /DNA_START=286 /DNA_END=510 /DNA_ORIENTATION=+
MAMHCSATVPGQCHPQPWTALVSFAIACAQGSRGQDNTLQRLPTPAALAQAFQSARVNQERNRNSAVRKHEGSDP